MLTPEQLEIIENSLLADLYDALQVEADAEIKTAIESQIKKIEKE